MFRSSLLGNGWKKDKTLCSVTSSIRDGIHFGFLSLVTSPARVPGMRTEYSFPEDNMMQSFNLYLRESRFLRKSSWLNDIPFGNTRPMKTWNQDLADGGPLSSSLATLFEESVEISI